MDKFLDFLNTIFPLSSEIQKAIKSKLKEHSFPKNHILIKELSQCDRLYYIEEGLARTYYIKDDKEVTDWFGFEGTLIGPVVRNFPQKAGPHSVELLEASKLSSIHFDALQELFDKYHPVERIGRIIALKAVLALQSRLDSIQFETAEDRYKNLLAVHPDITLRAPLGHIASFLGITQVTLSRIRAKF